VRAGSEKEHLDRHPEGEKEQVGHHDAAPARRDLPEEPRDGCGDRQRSRGHTKPESTHRRRTARRLEGWGLQYRLRRECHGLPSELRRILINKY
jgi:hypothetical protein